MGRQRADQELLVDAALLRGLAREDYAGLRRPVAHAARVEEGLVRSQRLLLDSVG